MATISNLGNKDMKCGNLRYEVLKCCSSYSLAIQAFDFILNKLKVFCINEYMIYILKGRKSSERDYPLVFFKSLIGNGEKECLFI